MADRSKMKAALKPSKRDNLFGDSEVTPSQRAPRIASQAKRKGEEYTERVTFPMSYEQKQFLYTVAEDFQRKRTDKQETINRNTVLRCLVEVLRETQFDSTDTANSEEELAELFKRKMLK
jgi:hypothetical protein